MGFLFWDLVQVFHMLAGRLSFSLGRQALSRAFLKSFSGNIALALDLALSAAFIAGVSPSLIQMMMAPSGEGSSETGQDLPASTSQPTVVAHRSDPLLIEWGDIKKPLIVDDLREKELEVRLNLHYGDGGKKCE